MEDALSKTPGAPGPASGGLRPEDAQRAADRIHALRLAERLGRERLLSDARAAIERFQARAAPAAERSA